MNFENDEMYVFPFCESINILYSSANDKWAIETEEDSFSVDEDSFEEDIIISVDLKITLEDFTKVKDIIMKRIEDEKSNN